MACRARFQRVPRRNFLTEHEEINMGSPRPNISNRRNRHGKTNRTCCEEATPECEIALVNTYIALLVKTGRCVEISQARATEQLQHLARTASDSTFGFHRSDSIFRFNLRIPWFGCHGSDSILGFNLRIPWFGCHGSDSIFGFNLRIPWFGCHGSDSILHCW